jgi:hypothetical protein
MVDKMLLVDGTHGIYAPQQFTKIFDPVKWGIEAHDPDWTCVRDGGPDDEFYWEAWDAVCDKAFLYDETNKRTWYLHNEDGNVFSIAYQVNEQTNLSEVAYFY